MRGTSDMQAEIDRVLAFWLDEVGSKGWYDQSGSLDGTIRALFQDLWDEAMARRLEPWARTPSGALALLIVLDQFPRNMFRGTAEAYRADPYALDVAKRAIGLRYDRRIREPERQFFYLPLMHSETLADQERAVRLIMLAMPETGARNLEHAIKHRDVIRRFGRFPSRNAALGRTDSEAERAYRAGGGYMA